jgi:hypothetical protein
MLPDFHAVGNSLVRRKNGLDKIRGRQRLQQGPVGGQVQLLNGIRRLAFM